MTYEIRTADLWPDTDMEMRAADGEVEGGLVIEGYALKFGVPSLPMQFAGVNRGKPFVEILETSAATRSVNANPDLTLRYNHNLLGLPMAGTRAPGPIARMDLTLNNVGLWQRSVVRDNAANRPAYDAVKDGLVRGMSFRFDRPKDNVRSDGTYPTEAVDGYGTVAVRRIHELRLSKELSLTESPAYPDTAAFARALADEINADPDELASAFRVLREQDTKLSPTQRDLIVAAVNAHAERPVLATEALVKNNSRREALNKLAG